MRDSGGRGPSRSPCWRTPEESCKGLGSVTLKMNTHHTLCLRPLCLRTERFEKETILYRLAPNSIATSRIIVVETPLSGGGVRKYHMISPPTIVIFPQVI